MRDKDQKFIFNDQELSLIKNTFSENDDLIYSIRKVLLQFDLNPSDIANIKVSLNSEVVRILKKKMLPEIGDEFPLTQLSGLEITLSNDLKVKSVEEMTPLFSAKEIEIAYLNQQFKFLDELVKGETPIQGELKLKDMGKIANKDPEQAFIGMTAYLFLLGYIDPMLIQIKVLAGQKSETVKEQKERLDRDKKANSNK